ncbi:contractile injection system protein, VgrG/Pvc8 family [Marinisporobacter balticus]|uniref:Late control gene D protein (GPD) n=1 Tax=Marinisporobacter balticus TaxID=2018667 RepID=A0A4R2K838_9FIRM|nr:contractile injection system protein, VgrG/Pvc8 family [Marinisporobacter balticus]TCO68077.1 late control gene D protein (GPD) [Marinisporobacter balticus]
MSIEAISYENIRISTYEMEYIKELKITNSINEHGNLELTGILVHERKDEDIHLTEKNTPIEVYYQKYDEKVSLFHGVITKIKIEVVEQVHNIYIKAKSYTYLMDTTKKYRSFQDKNMTSHDLIREVMKEYSPSDYKMQIPNVPIGQLVLQYAETDWVFLRRFVSKFYAGLFPAIELQNIHYYIGTPDIFVDTANKMNNYTIYKDLDLYEYMQKNHIKDVKEIDFTVYEIESFEILKLGNHIKFLGHDFYISEVQHDLKEGIIHNKYKIQLKNGLRQRRLYNKNIMGVSVDGMILEVQRDQVKVHLHIDMTQEKSKAYWFPYSTMAASPDGSGWYCMPEIGDQVRVYFPTKDEKDSFAVSAVSGYVPKKTNKKDRMGNPDVKYLRTVHDKEVRFTPSGILISCDSGQASIKLNKDGSISIIGQNSIHVNAVENIDIRAEKTLTMTANEKIDLMCDKGGKIEFTEAGEILVKGTEVKNN